MNKFHSVIAIATSISFLLGTPLEIRSEYIVSKNNLTDPPLPPKVIYDELICPDDPAEIKLYLSEREPGVTYEWVIHQMYDTLTSVSQNEDTVYVSDVRELSPIFPIVIIARNDCGITPKPLIIKTVRPLDFTEMQPDTICTGDLYEIVLQNITRVDRIDCYSWDLAGAQLVDGDTTSGDPFEISFDSGGLKKYSVTITDIDGCEHRKSYELYVFEDPRMPQIKCTSLTDAVLYSWTEDPNFTYELDFSKMPSSLISEVKGPTEIMVTGFISPCMYALLGIKVFGPSPSPCDMISENLPCRPSPRVEITFPTQQVFCADEENPIVQIDVRVNGESNPPGGEWVLPSQGFFFAGNVAMFDPNGLHVGYYGSEYWYTNPVDGCVEPAIIGFQIKNRPSAVVDNAEICIGESVTISYEDSDGSHPDIVVTPSLEGIEIDSFCNGTLVLAFPDLDQTYQITLTQSSQYCSPMKEEFIIEVNKKPNLDLQCSSLDTDKITLQWTDIDLVYDIEMNGESVVASYTSNSLVIDSFIIGQVNEFVISAEDPICGIVSDTIYCTAPTAIYEAHLRRLKIFPSPASDLLVVQSSGAFSSVAKMMDISGSFVKEVYITKGKNEIDVSDLSNGIYLLQLFTKNDIEIHHFIKVD